MDRVEETMGDECLCPGPSLLEALESGTGPDGATKRDAPLIERRACLIGYSINGNYFVPAFYSYPGSGSKGYDAPGSPAPIESSKGSFICH